MVYDYDLLVIGAGPGGLAAAKQAAKYGATVAIAEQEKLGGVCVNRGCIPKKLMVYAADFAYWLKQANQYGWSIDRPIFHWQQFVQARDQEIERLQQVQKQALLDAGIEILQGHAAFADRHTVTINDRPITADRILIAVGSQPSKPKSIPGIEYTITYREMFDLPALPPQLAVIGGGYVGVEFASTLNELGVDVTLMNQEACILTGFDQDVQAAVHEGLQQRGIRCLCNTTAKNIQPAEAGLQLTLTGDCPETLIVDTVLCATGQTPNLETLNLEKAGVERDGKAIAVDAYSRTSQDNIFAVGDCTNRLALTPVARTEGRFFADTVFGQEPRTVDYGKVPSAVFARPEAASVGLTETQAREQFGADTVECDRLQFQPLFNRLSQSQQPSLFKRVIHRPSGQILGVHLVGEQVAEIIQGIALAMTKGITKADLDRMIGIHPTSAEEFFKG